MARKLSDREAKARAYAICDEIETRAQPYIKAGMSPVAAFDRAMVDMLEE